MAERLDLVVNAKARDRDKPRRDDKFVDIRTRFYDVPMDVFAKMERIISKAVDDLNDMGDEFRAEKDKAGTGK